VKLTKYAIDIYEMLQQVSVDGTECRSWVLIWIEEISTEREVIKEDKLFGLVTTVLYVEEVTQKVKNIHDSTIQKLADQLNMN
jgi:hypothetical protein